MGNFNSGLFVWAAVAIEGLYFVAAKSTPPILRPILLGSSCFFSCLVWWSWNKYNGFKLR